MNAATDNGAGLPALWAAGDQQSISSDEIWCDAMGLAIAGAVAGQSLCLDTANGQRPDTGLHVLIPTKAWDRKVG